MLRATAATSTGIPASLSPPRSARGRLCAVHTAVVAPQLDEVVVNGGWNGRQESNCSRLGRSSVSVEALGERWTELLNVPLPGSTTERWRHHPARRKAVSLTESSYQPARVCVLHFSASSIVPFFDTPSY